MASDDDSSATSSPTTPDDSKGSSVSSGLREEYEDLLRYAVVTPNFDGKIKPGVSNKTTPTVAMEEGPGVHSVEVSQLELSETEEEEEDSLDKRPNDEEFKIQRTVSHRSPDATPPEIPHYTSKQMFQNKDHTSVNKKLELSRLEKKLDTWCLDLKHDVLAEFEQARLRAQEDERKKLVQDLQRMISEQHKLESHLKRANDLLRTYEQSIDRKDQIIQNLTQSLQKQKEKVELARSFAVWQSKHNDDKREVLTVALVTKMYRYNMKKKAFRSWFGLIQGRWKERIQKACQSCAEEICQKLNAEHQKHLVKIQESFEESQQEILLLRQQRDAFEENMKKAFMRGVCALNMEAMSMFQTQQNIPKVDSNCCYDNQTIDNTKPDLQQPFKAVHRSKGLPIKVERHQ